MSNDNPGKVHEPDANRDPLTGEPGAHPVGTGSVRRVQVRRVLPLAVRLVAL
jgi:hypothetical protein